LLRVPFRHCGSLYLLKLVMCIAHGNLCIRMFQTS
jgi:hypothetical protein